MKSAISTTALSSLLFSLLALTTLQASAEGGGDRLIQYREAQAQRTQTNQDESERFVQLVEEQPTAAGNDVAQEDTDSDAMPQNRYQSRIHHRSVEY